jgi:hypothetical protein
VYLHCCLNCRHHLPRAHNQCYIPNTEWVGDRKGPNFCEEFEFRDRSVSGDAAHEESARSAFNTLFGDDDARETPKGFDDLFGPGSSS